MRRSFVLKILASELLVFLQVSSSLIKPSQDESQKKEINGMDTYHRVSYTCEKTFLDLNTTSSNQDYEVVETEEKNEEDKIELENLKKVLYIANHFQLNQLLFRLNHYGYICVESGEFAQVSLNGCEYVESGEGSADYEPEVELEDDAVDGRKKVLIKYTIHIPLHEDKEDRLNTTLLEYDKLTNNFTGLITDNATQRSDKDNVPNDWYFETNQTDGSEIMQIDGIPLHKGKDNNLQKLDEFVDKLIAKDKNNGTLLEYEQLANGFTQLVAENISKSSYIENFANELSFITKLAEKVAYTYNFISDQEKFEHYNNSFASRGIKLLVMHDVKIAELTNITGSSIHSVTAKKEDIPEMSNLTLVELVISQDLVKPYLYTNSSTGMNSDVLFVSIRESSESPANVTIGDNLDVTVSLDIKKKTREPYGPVVRRRLHQGEEQSFIKDSEKCGVWKGVWTSKSNILTNKDSHSVDCKFKGTGTYSVLMDMHLYEPDNTLELLSKVCCGASAVALLFAISTLVVVQKMIKRFLLMEINICGFLFLGNIMVLLVVDKTIFNIPDTICSMFSALLHYVFLSAFCWMASRGLYLYIRLNKMAAMSSWIRNCFVISGYLIPPVGVLFTFAVGVLRGDKPYGRDELCWLTSPGYTWAFTGPVAIITAINLLVSICAICKANSLQRNLNRTKFQKLGVLIRGGFSLSFTLGTPWAVGLLSFENYYEIILHYAFVILNGLQGVFIFLILCIWDKEIKGATLRLLKLSKRENCATTLSNWQTFRLNPIYRPPVLNFYFN